MLKKKRLQKPSSRSCAEMTLYICLMYIQQLSSAYIINLNTQSQTHFHFPGYSLATFNSINLNTGCGFSLHLQLYAIFDTWRWSSAFSFTIKHSIFIVPILCSTLYSEINFISTLFRELFLLFLKDWLILQRWIFCYFDLQLNWDSFIEIRTFKYWVNMLTTTIT